METESLHEGLALLGGGGHALVVADAAAALRVRLAGFYDDDPQAPASRDFAHLGTLADAVARAPSAWIIAIGNLEVRAGVIETMRTHEQGAAAVIHPAAVVAPSAVIGRGVFIGPGAIVNARAEIGEHAIVNSGAVIEHECVVGINAHIGPGAAIGGGVHVGANTLVGIGSTVLPGLRIGSASLVGAGAAVIENVSDSQRVAGVPARPMDR